MMPNNVENIITKFNYDAKLATLLRQLYPEFIKYFGIDKEPIIYEALLNTPIVLCSNIYDELIHQGLIDQDNFGLVNAGDLKRASGVYQNYPVIEYDSSTESFKITAIKRIVAVSAPSFDSEYSKTVLIHELSHLIKSYYEECTITQDILTTRSGLIETKEKLTYQDGKVTKTLISEKSIGLEEGLTSVIEEDIARLIVNPHYQVSGYGVINVIARTLMEKYHLKEYVLNAQILNEKANLIKELDTLLKPDAYVSLDSICDQIYKLSLKMYSEIFDPQKMHQTSSELNATIKNEYLPLMKDIDEARSKNL